MKSNLVDLEGKIHHRTERAALFSLTGDRKDAVWLPLAVIEVEGGEFGHVTVAMPEELAVEKGLV